MTEVRIATLSGYTDLLEELGCNAETALLKSGQPATFFHDHDVEGRITHSQLESMLEAAAEIAQCEHFGALLGSRQNIHLFGLIGYLMKQSRDVRSALNELSVNYEFHALKGSLASLEDYGELASVSFTVTSPQCKTAQMNLLAMSQSMIILRGLCGDEWRPVSVNFSHKAPVDRVSPRKIYGVPLGFNQEKTEIVFSSEFLNRPISMADPKLRRILQEHIKSLQEKPTAMLSRQVESLIRRSLPKGECSIANIANQMAIHRRTLHRLLKKNHSSFTALLEGIRKEIATERLKNSELSIVQLADYLGYSDNSAFTKAFKRWYGVSPRQWKKLHGRDSDD